MCLYTVVLALAQSWAFHSSNHNSLGHPGRVYYVPKWQFARVSNIFTLNLFPNLFKHFVHRFQDYYVDLNSSSTYINAQGFVSAPL